MANLNVAVEGNDHIEFFSPAANMAGFEHPPQTQKQKDAIENALKRLKEGETLFILTPGSKSRLATPKVDTDIKDETDPKPESEHSHERHSEFQAQYDFISKKPDKLAQIEVKLFQIFPGIEHIEVQLLTGSNQTAMELSAKKNKISW